MYMYIYVSVLYTANKPSIPWINIFISDLNMQAELNRSTGNTIFELKVSTGFYAQP